MTKKSKKRWPKVLNAVYEMTESPYGDRVTARDVAYRIDIRQSQASAILRQLTIWGHVTRRNIAYQRGTPKKEYGYCISRKGIGVLTYLRRR